MLADDLREIARRLHDRADKANATHQYDYAYYVDEEADRLDAIAARLEGRDPMAPDSRERCKCCGRANPVGFNVPDEVWQASVPDEFKGRVLCIMCFDQFATERGVDWSAHRTEWWPVSGVAALLDKEAESHG